MQQSDFSFGILDMLQNLFSYHRLLQEFVAEGALDSQSLLLTIAKHDRMSATSVHSPGHK